MSEPHPVSAGLDDFLSLKQAEAVYSRLLDPGELRYAVRTRQIGFYDLRTGPHFLPRDVGAYFERFIVRIGESRAPATWVYFALQESIEPLIKIGITTNIKKRLRGLSTANGFDVRLLGFRAGDIVLERALHAQFADHRVRGEWFKPCKAIKDYIAQNCEAR